VSRGNGPKPKADPASLGTMASLFQRRAKELEALRSTHRPVNLAEPPRRAEPTLPPPPPERIISPEEAMRMAFEEATDARSRKFLSEGMNLGPLAVAGDRPEPRRDGPKAALGADYDFEREMIDTQPLRTRKPDR